MRTPVSAIALACALAVFGAGCASSDPATPSPIAKEPAQLLETTDGLRQWWVDAPGAMFVKPPRPDLDRYDSYLIEPPKLHFLPLSAKPTRNEAIRLSKTMARILRNRVESSLGWYEATEPGPTVVRVRSMLSNIEFSGPDASAHTRTTAFVSASGLVHFTLEFQDSQTRDPILRYGSRRPLPGGTFSGPSWHELDRARLVMRSFALDARPNLESLVSN